MAKRGRRKGTKNGQGKALAPIVDWTPQHEIVVQLNIAGWGNEDVAKHVKLSKERVSQILQDPRAKISRGLALQRIRDSAMQNIDDRLVELAEKSLDRLAETINFDAPSVTSDFKRHQDNVSLSLVKPFMVDRNVKSQKEGGNIPESLFSRLVAAMENSNKAKEIQDAEYEIVEEKPVRDSENTVMPSTEARIRKVS